MRGQALAFGAEVTEGLAESLSKEGELFVARVGDLVFRARSVLLATGMVNNSPEIHGTAFAGGQTLLSHMRWHRDKGQAGCGDRETGTWRQ